MPCSVLSHLNKGWELFNSKCSNVFSFNYFCPGWSFILYLNWFFNCNVKFVFGILYNYHYIPINIIYIYTRSILNFKIYKTPIPINYFCSTFNVSERIRPHHAILLFSTINSFEAVEQSNFLCHFQF